MFHRRLLLLLAAAALVITTLGMQTLRLTTGASHDRRLAAAERALLKPELIGTVRGRVLDRKGRVLAEDEPGYEITVDYALITGEWSYDEARAAAYREHRAQWGEMDDEAKEALVAEVQPAFETQAEALWQTLEAVSDVPRGELERRRAAIQRKVQGTAAYVWEQWRRQRERELGQAVRLHDVARPIAEQEQRHAIVTDVTPEARQRVQAFIAEAERSTDDAAALAAWRGVRVVRPRQRAYPHEGPTTVTLDRAHLPSPLRSDEPLDVTVEGVGLLNLGQMRPVWEQDAADRPFSLDHDRGGYRTGDLVGSSGIEAGMERRLRGTRGYRVRHLDTGEVNVTPPTEGRDVHLTLDIALQARIQAIMSPAFGLMQTQSWHIKDAEADDPRFGTPLNGAAVVLDAKTSEVLAAVSVPTISLRSIASDDAKPFDDHISRPYINRAIAMPYQPGSTIKPFTLIAAVTSHVHDAADPIDCTGYLIPPGNPNKYRCWIYKTYGNTHGPLLGSESLARSCNIYFYTLGREMGVSGLANAYSAFGLGRVPDVGIPGGVAGDLPDPAAIEAGEQHYVPADAIFMGIGQGPVRWTPMQAAGAYGTLARRGVFTEPTFIKDVDLRTPRERYNLQLDPRSVEQALQGLRDVVGERHGTGRYLATGQPGELIFNAEGVTVLGKSGTAQAVPLRVDSDSDGRITSDDRVVKTGDHAWFTALVFPEGSTVDAGPTYVIAVIVEYAGSGGQVAGPVANQIIYALRAEGYFP